jgi:hypothetical protein
VIVWAVRAVAGPSNGDHHRPTSTNVDQRRQAKQQVNHYVQQPDQDGDGRVDLYAGFCPRRPFGRRGRSSI